MQSAVFFLVSLSELRVCKIKRMNYRCHRCGIAVTEYDSVYPVYETYASKYLFCDKGLQLSLSRVLSQTGHGEQAVLVPPKHIAIISKDICARSMSTHHELYSPRKRASTPQSMQPFKERSTLDPLTHRNNSDLQAPPLGMLVRIAIPSAPKEYASNIQ